MAGRSCAALGALLATLALSGCDSVPTATPPAEAAPAPGVEALAFLPGGADVVAVVDTERESWRDALRVARRTGLAPRLADAVARLGDAGVDLEHADELRGNLLAWAPREQVAALVVTDSARLDAIVAARLREGALRDLGTHAEGRVLAGRGLAVGIRGPAVVVAPSIAVVRRALDRRASGGGYSAPALKRAVSGLPVDALVRVAVDADALIARHLPRARAVPLVDAVDTAGLALDVDPDGATLDAVVRLDERLLAADLPLRGGRAATPRPFGGIHLGVVDLPHVLKAAYRAAFAGAPSATARAEVAQIVVRGRRRIDPARDLLDALAGPATLQLDADGVLLRAPLRDTGRAERAVGRLSARLPRVLAAAGIDGVVMRPLAGLKAAVRESDVLAVFGVADDVLVAADSRPETLVERAATDSADDDDLVPGPLALRAGPGALEELLGIEAGDLRGWVRPQPRGLRAHLTLRLTGR